MNNKTIIAMMLFIGCNSGDVEPGPLAQTDTDGGLGDTGGTGDTNEANPDECWDFDAPTGAVRWQCEGRAEAVVFATLDVEIPDIVPNAEFIQQFIDSGHFDFGRTFGPWNQEAYDDPGVDACCLPTIAQADEEGADETGAGE